MRYQNPLFLDDARSIAGVLEIIGNPERFGDITLVTTLEDFEAHINTYGVPDFVTFDHDIWGIKPVDGYRIVLADGQSEITGKDAARFLVEYCHDNRVKFPDFSVHSSNYEGALWIASYIASAYRANYIF